MQQAEIKVIRAQLAHRFHHGFLRRLITVMLRPDLGGQKDIPARHAGMLNRRADLPSSPKLIDGFADMLPVFTSEAVSEMYYAENGDLFDTVLC